MSSKEKQERMFELIRRWKASGETMKDFVAYQGVALSKFQYWHKKYREQKESSGGVIQMRAGGLTEIRLRYPNGVEVLIPQGFPSSMITELIHLG